MAFNPTCPCHERPIPDRPYGFHSMSSVQMRVYGETHARPDIVLHADCVEQREKLDRLSDEFVSVCAGPDFYRLPEELRAKVNTVNVYLLSGH